MEIYKTKWFQRWAVSEKIVDDSLIEATNEISEGLVDAKLSDGLYKKRLKKNNKGKRSSYRTLVAFKENEKIVFLFGFSKNEKENISLKEKKLFKGLATVYTKAEEKEIRNLLQKGVIFEVKQKGGKNEKTKTTI